MKYPCCLIKGYGLHLVGKKGLFFVCFGLSLGCVTC